MKGAGKSKESAGESKERDDVFRHKMERIDINFNETQRKLSKQLGR